MDMTGEQRIAAPRQAVWDALNDADALKAALPGCEEVNKISDTEFSAKLKLVVGPVKAQFSGQVTLSDIDAPNGYTLAGQGSGGAAGFGKGEAKVTLTDDGGGTVISYTVHATVGGKLAQIGQRLIDATAKKMARQFFESFAAYLEVEGAPGQAAAEATAPPAAAKVAGGQGLFWGMMGVALVILWVVNH